MRYILFEKYPINGKRSYRGTVYRAERSTLPPIQKTNTHVKHHSLDINNDLFTDDWPIKERETLGVFNYI